MEQTETKGKFHEIVEWIKKHKSLLFLITAIATVLILGLRLMSSHQHHKQLEQKYEEQVKQLEHQNDVISALTAKNNELSAKKQKMVITSDTVKQQLNSLSNLVTQEYVYTNAAKRESNTTWVFGWTVPFSGNSLLVSYDGTIKAGVDLNEVTVDVDEDTHTVTVTLPDSKITDNNIPQETITILEIKNGLFNEVTFDNYNEFISEEKLVMEQKAIDRGLLAKADKEARSAVQALLSAMPGIGNGEGEYKLILE